MPGYHSPDITGRFWEKVDASGGADACWPWVGARMPSGHGRFAIHHGDAVYAHRFAYALEAGAIPEGLSVLHNCDNPPCCNPAHLRLGTQQDNVADMLSRGRHFTQHTEPLHVDPPPAAPGLRGWKVWKQAFPTIEERFWSKVEKTDSCWEWTGFRSRFGHGYFVRKHGDRVAAHRFSYELVHGPVSEGQVVCHQCDNPSCVRPDHLFAGTPLDNTRDMIRKGRMPQGSKRASSLLNEDQVGAILSAHAAGKSQVALAGEYGVSASTIWKIVNRKKWRHVPIP